jgi:hypothetical protein
LHVEHDGGTELTLVVPADEVVPPRGGRGRIAR